jgi:hypothetical protein
MKLLFGLVFPVLCCSVSLCAQAHAVDVTYDNVTANQNFWSVPNVANGSAYVRQWNPYAPVDQRHWNQTVDTTGNWVLFGSNDAESASSQAMVANRAGLNVNSVYFPNGKLGIGTSGPQYKLDVVSSGAPGSASIYARATDGGMTRFGLQNGYRHWSISNYGSSFTPNGAFAISDETLAVQRLIIDTNGSINMTGNYFLVLPPTGDAHLAVFNKTGNIASLELDSVAASGHQYSIRSWAASGAGKLTITDTTANVDRVQIDSAGNMTVGTAASNAKLSVIGTITSKEIKVTTSGADYVFADGYVLRPLAEVEAFVTRERHLPGVMTAKEMSESGLPVAQVVTVQLAKIEELTLYAIQQQKVIDGLVAQQKAAAEVSERQGAALAQVLAKLAAIEALRGGAAVHSP